MFSKEDLEQIKGKGISLDKIEKQLEVFRNGAKHIKLYRNIEKYQDINEITTYPVKPLDEKYKIVSFIPASGAATRMFDNLYKTLDEINKVGEENFILKTDNNPQSTFTFFNKIKKFAFYDELKECLKNDKLSLNELLKKNKYKTILEYILTEKGLNFGSEPKALIPFHKEDGRIKYAFEEHISEAVRYTKSKDVYLHFTLSPEYVDEFYSKAHEVKKYYESKFKKNIHIEISVQSPATDTIAVNLDNTLFRNPDNSLLFRPGGHGALIHNLNKIEADFIMIKNIDNVVPDSKKKLIIKHRSEMLGNFLNLCELKHYYVNLVNHARLHGEEIDISLIGMTCFTAFKIFLPQDYESLQYKEKLEVLFNLLNRPMRMCAMVRNEGEPGGGPFVTYKNDGLSMQIVEKSQIDMENPSQAKMLEEAKYFNPVDIICFMIDVNGEKFNLEEYIDNDAIFISNKTKDGKALKALELPGLWNGAMSDWITIFVEVPIETFNPVKTVNDLLRPAHQG
ncbi:DUF4301 family protein [Bacteroidales bacterium OttesenSCG-928-K03]|nr:DUF4301 family protein [Bacteroidales bacterium OttesenSCG-928-K03]